MRHACISTVTNSAPSSSTARPTADDLLIWPGQIKSDWWRREGHLLQLADVAEALAAEPQVLVVGTGEPGQMRLDPELVAYLQDKGVELVARPTREACRVINELDRPTPPGRGPAPHLLNCPRPDSWQVL